jgi:RsiW-degrading membrane proteinase PrsW (M82 family)
MFYRYSYHPPWKLFFKIFHNFSGYRAGAFVFRIDDNMGYVPIGLGPAFMEPPVGFPGIVALEERRKPASGGRFEDAVPGGPGADLKAHDGEAAGSFEKIHGPPVVDEAAPGGNHEPFPAPQDFRQGFGFGGHENFRPLFKKSPGRFAGSCFHQLIQIDKPPLPPAGQDPARPGFSGMFGPREEYDLNRFITHGLHINKNTIIIPEPMNGLWILFLLIFTAALPVFFAFLMFKRLKLKSLSFLLSLAAGILALLIAAILQNLLPFPEKGRGGEGGGLAALLFDVFIRTAFIEEFGKFITLCFLLRGTKNRGDPSFASGAVAGLTAGLGFAAVESASYGAADIGIAFLRVFTAAPLHGACGARAGAAAELWGKSPVRGALFFFAALMIHGIYDLLIASPGAPSFLAVPIALAALGSSLAAIRRGAA